jgi:N-acylglucosamine-6-phosphate 2-epimerase
MSGLSLDRFVAVVEGRLIVSCQASAGHPLRDTATLVRMANAAVSGGAAAIRCGGVGGVADVEAIAVAVDVPVIGLTKDGTQGVYITPTVGAALAVVAAGADVVAADATLRPRPDGSAFTHLVAAVHGAGRLVMADVATLEEGVAAVAAGADIVASTLAGYTPQNPRCDGPDLGLVSALRSALPDTVIVAEGRYHDPSAAAEAIGAGATSVVVGTAITDPAWITQRYVEAVSAAGPPPIGARR